MNYQSNRLRKQRITKATDQENNELSKQDITKPWIIEAPNIKVITIY